MQFTCTTNVWFLRVNVEKCLVNVKKWLEIITQNIFFLKSYIAIQKVVSDQNSSSFVFEALTLSFQS